jgi:hypothetical protein
VLNTAKRVHDGEDAAPTGYSGPAGGIIWLDDDLAGQAEDTGEWLAAHPHVLALAPDLLTGLTHEQLDAIEAWL